MDTSLRTTDGLSLHLQHWPAPGAARGTVLVVHGLGEHVGRYAHVAQRLNALAWNVVGADHRGHGRSGGARARLVDGDDLLRDLALVVDAARAEHAGPLVMLGHSLGGLVAARFVAEGLAGTPASWWRPVDALVLSSPALDLGMSAVQKLMLALGETLAPDLAVGNGLKPAWVSRDAAVVQAYQDDPLVHDRVTPRLVRFMVDSARVVQQRAAQWTVPTLLMYAGSDRCVAAHGSRAFAAAAPPSVVQAREFPALFHEIFNEPEQDQVFAELAAWLNARGL
jgi:alpha-beta hydrolase superfamily lysophospholipase